MSDIISCPSCQRKLQVPEALAGQDVQCPTCGATFVAKPAAAPSARSERRPPERWDSGGPSPYDRPYDRPAERRPYGEGGGYDDFDEYGGRHRRDLMPHRGPLILTLGLLSVVGAAICITAVLGPVAWIMGNTDMAEIRAGRMDPDGEGLTQAGRICGIIGTGFLVLFSCFFGLMFLGAMTGR